MASDETPEKEREWPKPFTPAYSVPVGVTRVTRSTDIPAGGYVGQRDNWQNTRLSLETVSDCPGTLKVGEYYVHIDDLYYAIMELKDAAHG